MAAPSLSPHHTAHTHASAALRCQLSLFLFSAALRTWLRHHPEGALGDEFQGDLGVVHLLRWVVPAGQHGVEGMGAHEGMGALRAWAL
jgi:hypothetical protein